MFKVLLLLMPLTILPKPKGLVFKETTFDFGQKPERHQVEHSFEFQNTGTEPVVISSHHVNCHCTTVLYSKAPVLAGESGEIIVRYDASKIGKFWRKVEINTNSGNYDLVIKGEIIPSKQKVNPITGQVIE